MGILATDESADVDYSKPVKGESASQAQARKAKFYTQQRQNLEKKAGQSEGSDTAGGPRTLQGAKDKAESVNTLRKLYSKLTPEQKAKTQAGKMDRNEGAMKTAIDVMGAIPFMGRVAGPAGAAQKALTGGAQKALTGGAQKALTGGAQKALQAGKDFKTYADAKKSRLMDMVKQGVAKSREMQRMAKAGVKEVDRRAAVEAPKVQPLSTGPKASPLKSVTPKKAAAKPAVKKSEPVKPTAKKSEPVKPTAKKSEPVKPTAKKPTTKNKRPITTP
jgi:hypothetical protein